MSVLRWFRWITLALAVILAAACGSDGADTEGTESEEESSAGVGADEADDSASEDPESSSDADGGEVKTADDTDDTDSNTDTGGADPVDADVEVFAVRGRPEYISGGNVLVEFVADGVATGDVSFAVDGQEVESVDRGDGYYLVSGLDEGESELAPVGFDGVDPVVVTNYPITGPIFSGPHQQPMFCTFESFDLAPSGDDNCSAETQVRWGHIDDERTFVAADSAVDIPEGEIIVRLETGTINRGIYQVAAADPSFGSEPIEPGRNLVYAFGGGCGTGHNQGGNLGAQVLNEAVLEAGYLVATNTFNTFQTHCNDVLSAETLMMTREHIDETLGPIGLTIGTGGSGGAIQQYSIAQNYPGLLDALNPSVSFPDAVTISGGVTDCGLLANYWDSETGESFSEEARTAVQGHGTAAFCSAWITSFLGNIDASSGCAAVVDEESVYDPEENPDGIRCTLQDSAINVFGAGDDGFGRRALDNIGIEYGRAALIDGLISVDQFLDLNRNIGGYDLDGNLVEDRIEADAEVVELAYASGRVLRGDSAVADIPIIDIDRYSDLAFDIHDRFRLFTIRARITGSDDPSASEENRVIWSRPGEGLIASVTQSDSTEEAAETEAISNVEIFDLLAEWSETGTRPGDVADDCLIDGERTAGDEVFANGEPCAEAYPFFGDPRTAAGASIANDIVKCTTMAPDPDAYGVDFTDEQAADLAEVFPDGVCDWSQPGVGQVPLLGTWLAY